mgnify:CR=1 FL=1
MYQGLLRSQSLENRNSISNLESELICMSPASEWWQITRANTSHKIAWIVYHWEPYLEWPYQSIYLRKQLAEQLILSKMDYGDLVFNPLPNYLLKRLQEIQFSAATFVTGNYVNSTEAWLKLNRLPMHERRQFNLL